MAWALGCCPQTPAGAYAPVPGSCKPKFWKMTWSWGSQPTFFCCTYSPKSYAETTKLEHTKVLLSVFSILFNQGKVVHLLVEFSVLKMDSTHSLQERHLQIYCLTLRLSMQFIFVCLLFLSDKIEKTKIKIVKCSKTKLKAFYLERVGPKDGFPTSSMKFHCLVCAL